MPLQLQAAAGINMDSPAYSIVIVTRNRADILHNVLASLQELNDSGPEYEIIVVDNGSTDDTAGAVARKMCNSGLLWKVVREEEKGICRARNAGYQNASGDWVVYLDDDALVPPDWLQAYAAAIARYPEAAVLGGPATLSRDIRRPWWWCSKFDWTMSCQDYGETLMPYPEGAHPYGLNMMIRREVLNATGGFDPLLDDAISSFADETDLFIRIMKQGGQLIYVPGARVVHDVGQDRFTWRRYMARCELVGRSHAFLDNRHGTWFRRSLARRMASAGMELLRYRTPAVIFQELHAWNGYRKQAAQHG